MAIEFAVFQEPTTEFADCQRMAFEFAVFQGATIKLSDVQGAAGAGSRNPVPRHRTQNPDPVHTANWNPDRTRPRFR